MKKKGKNDKKRKNECFTFARVKRYPQGPKPQPLWPQSLLVKER